jgi:hypothetical protein
LCVISVQIDDIPFCVAGAPVNDRDGCDARSKCLYGCNVQSTVQPAALHFEECAIEGWVAVESHDVMVPLLHSKMKRACHVAAAAAHVVWRSCCCRGDGRPQIFCGHSPPLERHGGQALLLIIHGKDRKAPRPAN